LEIVGLIPAAGKATRLGQLPFSKELYPVGFESDQFETSPKVVSKYLIENMQEAGVSEFHFVIRNGKWDIPAYYKSGDKFNCSICYHITNYDFGVPFTLWQAYHFYKNNIVLMGFPDVLVNPKNAFTQLLVELNEKNDTPLVLGLFSTNRPEKYDMVEMNEEGRIINILIKPEFTQELKFAWAIAAWKPKFSNFLKSFIENKLKTKSSSELAEIEYHLGDVIISAIKSGMKVKGVIIDKGSFIDIGTPEDLINSSSFVS